MTCRPPRSSHSSSWCNGSWSPTEPAALIAWLCEAEASGVTGAALSVDGGLTTS